MKIKKILVTSILILALAIGIAACTTSDEIADEEISAADGNQPPENREEMGRPPEGEVPADGERPERTEGEAGQAPGGMMEPDFAAAAEQLGVSEEALIEAFGEPGESEPDFPAIAAELGVSEEALIEAIGMQGGGPGGQPGGGNGG